MSTSGISVASVTGAKQFSRQGGMRGAKSRASWCRAVASGTAIVLAGMSRQQAWAATSNATWNNAGATGLWNTAANWSPGGVPSNGTNGFSDYNVSIGTPAPCVLNISPVIDNLTLTSGGVLQIQYNSTLTVNGPTLADNGSIVVNSNQGGSLADLAFGANTSITGSGVITLQQPGSNAQLSAAAGITVTQAAAHTIAGYGQLNLGFVNNGTVNANVSAQSLTIGTYNISNNATLEATLGGTLGISGIVVNQGAGGLITAANASAVALSSANISGGILSSTGNGYVTLSGSTLNTLANVTNTATIDVPYNNTLNIVGNLSDSGNIIINSNSGGAVAQINFNGGTLSGTGSITLQQGGPNAVVNGALTQAAGHTIQGYGQINAALINNGTVNANANGQSLTLQTSNTTNNSLMEATGGGTLGVSGINLTQGAGGLITAGANSAVALSNANITGGTLSTTGNGYFTIAGTSTLINLTNNAVIDIPQPNALKVSGNLVDNGTIVLNSNLGGAVASLTFNGGAVTGAGTIVLQQGGPNAQVNGSLTQGLGHTISGYGTINATLTNNGVVNANVIGSSLYFEAPTLTNNNLIEATGGGGLYFDSAIAVNNSNGTISAANGGGVTFANGTSITGGTLSATAPALFTLSTYNPTAGFTASLSNVTIAAGTELDVPQPQLLAIGGSTLTDNGLIVINSNQQGAVAELLFKNNTLLTGSGTIRIEQSGVNGLLATNPGATVTQDIHHSITGYGEIAAALVNNNIVNANVNGSQLLLTSSNMSNNALFEATSGGTLAISGINVTQGVAGQMTAATGSAVTLAATNISGGSLSSSGSGIVAVAGNTTVTLTNVTNNAVLNVPYNNLLSVNSNLTDNGLIVVNSQAGGAVAALNFSGGTVSGSGAIVLQQGGNNAQINGAFTQSAGHTIQGYGQINGAFTNNGLINGNVFGNTLTIASPTATNNSVIETSQGGGLNITGTVLTQNASGQILSTTFGNYGGVTLTNATISGGTLNGAGTFLISGLTTLNNVTNNSTINLPYNNLLNVTGNLIDNGTIVDNSTSGGAVAAINFSGGTLSGTGSIVLQQPGQNAEVNGPLTQALGHTIQGYGQINGPFVNNGLVSGNVNTAAITLAGSITNNSVIQAIGGGGLTIAGTTVNQSTGGIINASTGTLFSLSNGNVSGGTILGAGIWTVAGVSTLDNLTNYGTFEIPYNNQLNITHTVTDNGLIVVNSTGGGAVATLNFSGGTINGSGTIQLQQVGANAQIDGAFTQGAGHTISGYGEINGALTNSGTVDASVPANTLSVLGANTSNAGLFQASNGATLAIGAGILTNFSGVTLTGGSYEVDANSTILLSGTIVNNAASITITGNNATFAAVVPLANNSGSFTIGQNGIFSTAGSLISSGTVNTAAPSGAIPAGNLTINGTFTESAGQTNDNGLLTVTGATSITGGVLTVGPAGFFTGSPINVGSAGQLLANGILNGAPALTDNGIAIFGANPGTGILSRTLSSFSIGANGSASVVASALTANRTLLITPLTIAGATNAWTGKLDLGNNDLDLTSGPTLATVTNQIKQGYSGGTWQGSKGITSSTAAANATHLTALGVIQNNQSGSALYTASHQFDGTTPGVADILVKYTYYGDANLDGKIDGTDYSRIDAAYLADKSNASAATGWYNGDFNYDGVIDGSDYTLIDNAFNQQGTVLAAQLASPTAQLADAGVTSAVPEPATMGLLLLGTVGMLGRRRR
jgi:hypothetical protein